MDVLATDLDESTGGCAVVSDELSGHGNRLQGVDSEARAGAVVGLLTKRIWVEATSILVTVARAATFGAGASTNAGNVARVGSESSGVSVGLPKIHLVTAGAIIVGVHRAVEPGARRALSVAVTSTVCGTAWVVLAPTTAEVHLGQVEGAVLATHERRGIDIEADLLAEKLETLVVLAVGREKVYTRGGVLVDAVIEHVLCHGQAAAGGRDTLGGIIGDTLDVAVDATCLLGAAESLVEAAGCRAGVVVGIA